MGTSTSSLAPSDVLDHSCVHGLLEAVVGVHVEPTTTSALLGHRAARLFLTDLLQRTFWHSLVGGW